MNLDKRMNELRKQIEITSWDLNLIHNEKVKVRKMQQLEEFKREYTQLRRQGG